MSRSRNLECIKLYNFNIAERPESSASYSKIWPWTTVQQEEIKNAFMVEIL